MAQSALPDLPSTHEDLQDPEHVAKVTAELNRVLGTAVFQRSPGLSRLLSYMVENELRGDLAALKETVIGNVLYGRPSSYDPRIDAVVRVNAKRLRERLEEYSAEHPESALRIVLHRGSYIPVYLAMRGNAGEDASPDGGRAEPDAAESLGSLEAIHEIASEPASPPWWRGKPMLFGAVLAALAVVCVVAVAMLRGARPTGGGDMWSVRPFARLGGSQQFGDFSPDGQRLVFVSSRPDDPAQDLSIEEVSSDSPRQVTSDGLAKSRPVWSPDGRRIAFARLNADGSRTVMVLTVASGEQTVVATLQGQSPWLCREARLSWSRDGATLFSSGLNGGQRGCGLVAINLKSHAVRGLTEPPTGSVGDLEAAAAPDGKSVAFLRSFSFMSGDLFAVNLKDGTLRQLTKDKRDISGFAWSDDGKALIVASNRMDGDRRLWTVPVDGGNPTALTDGSSAPYFPAVGGLGRRMVYTRYEKIGNMWRHTRLGDTEIVGNGSVNGVPAVSSDGRRLVYNSNRAGVWTLWVSDADGRNARQLLRDDGSMMPSSASWSPDNRRIVFECRQTGNSNLCAMDADGGPVEQVTRSGANHFVPSWSRDGKAIYYSSDVTGRCEIYRQELRGGEPVQVTQRGGIRAAESPDGKTLYVHRGEALDQGHAPGGMVAMAVEDIWRGDVAALIAAEGRVFLQAELGPSRLGDWQPGADGVLFATAESKGKAASILSYNVETGKTRMVAAIPLFEAAATISFATGVDEQSLYYRKETAHTELALMQRKAP